MTTLFILIKYVLIVHRGVRQEMNFVRLSHDRVTYDVDRDVSTAIQLFFIRLYCIRNVAIYIISDYRETNEQNSSPNFVYLCSTYSSTGNTFPKGALYRTTDAVYCFAIGGVAPPSLLSFMVSLYVNCTRATTEITGQWTICFVAQPTKESRETTTRP